MAIEAHSQGNEPPFPTECLVQAGDGTQYRMWSDGSLRRDPPKARGKARVKALKRLRHR